MLDHQAPINPSSQPQQLQHPQPQHPQLQHQQLQLQLQQLPQPPQPPTSTISTTPVAIASINVHSHSIAMADPVAAAADTPSEFNELNHVNAVWDNMRGNSPIYDFLLSDLQFVSASKGLVTARLLLGPNHVNSRKGIHGAVSATLADFMGGVAISTHGMMKTGASVDIHVTYLSTATVGDEIEIVGTANKVGRSMAFTSIKITKIVDGEPGPIVATASHTKYIRQ